MKEYLISYAINFSGRCKIKSLVLCANSKKQAYELFCSTNIDVKECVIAITLLSD